MPEVNGRISPYLPIPPHISPYMMPEVNDLFAKLRREGPSLYGWSELP